MAFSMRAIFQKMRDYYTDESKWTKGRSFRDAYGREIYLSDVFTGNTDRSKIASCCLMGAKNLVDRDLGTSGEDMRKTINFMHSQLPDDVSGIAHFNDSVSFQAVLIYLDTCIANAPS